MNLIWAATQEFGNLTNNLVLLVYKYFCLPQALAKVLLAGAHYVEFVLLMLLLALNLSGPQV